VAKVTGAKLYASDFRAADLPGWPQNTSHAMLIRAADATHVLTEIDLSRLTGALKPSVVVTADDLARAGTRVPEFFAGDLLCPVGKTPLYLGQPVALLIFEDFDAFDQARLALRDQAVLKFAAETGPVSMPDYGAFRFTRVGGPTPDAPDVYSPSRNGWVSPARFESTGRPLWAPAPIPTEHGYDEAAIYGEKIRAELAPALLVLDREFETQSVDPMALEPENGLAWYDARNKNLELVVSVQSAAQIATAIAYLLGNAQAAFKPAHINTRWRIRGTRPHAVPALRRVGGDVLPEIVRCDSPTTASSSFNRVSSGTHSRSARRSASIGRPARSSASPLTTPRTAEASPTFQPMWQSSLPPPRSESTMLRKSM
jgi:CO/xanthine dehydrogenase Mo-binding subunit